MAVCRLPRWQSAQAFYLQIEGKQIVSLLFYFPKPKMLDFQSPLLEKDRSSSPVTAMQLRRSAGARSLIKQREEQGETIQVLSHRLP